VDKYHLCLREKCHGAGSIGTHSCFPPWVEGRHNGGQRLLIVWTDAWRYLGDAPSDRKLRVVESISVNLQLQSRTLIPSAECEI
jgi:hypothetical protein